LKPLLVLGKVFLIGCLWSLFFIEGIRVVLLINWHFDIFWPPHWVYLWNLWHDGWVIDQAKEWAFILILLATVPMWLTGWIFLSVINWGKLFDFVIMKPLRAINARMNDITSPAHNNLALKRVVKKKSYKEIRPNMKGQLVSEDPFDNHPVSLSIKDEDSNIGEGSSSSMLSPASSPSRGVRQSTSATKSSASEEKKPFTHSVFDFDDDDDDFELDFDYGSKPAPAKQKDDFDDENDFDIEESSGNNRKRTRASDDKPRGGLAFDEFENDIRDEDFDDDDYEEDNRRSKNSSKKRSRRDDFDDDFDFDRPQKRDNNRRSRNEKENNRREREDRDDRDTRRNKNDRRQAEDKRGEQQRRNDAGNPIVDTLRQKGYEIISGVTIKNTYIDYIAVDENVICLCLVDKEVGDWLADEERFNNEEPLWFSETAHRVSPVRMVDIARNMLAKKLRDCKITFDLRAFVIIQNGNIINAEDMFEVWHGVDVDVTRINRGSPKEIPLFSKSVDEVEQRIDSLRFESLKKLIRSIS